MCMCISCIYQCFSSSSSSVDKKNPKKPNKLSLPYKLFIMPTWGWMGVGMVVRMTSCSSWVKKSHNLEAEGKDGQEKPKREAKKVKHAAVAVVVAAAAAAVPAARQKHPKTNDGGDAAAGRAVDWMITERKAERKRERTTTSTYQTPSSTDQSINSFTRKN